MDELRYLLRVVARALRKRWREPATRRQVIPLLLAFLVGALLGQLSRRWIPLTVV
ncbi:MAG: hypothetical protein ACK4UU_02065 [Fimbriimonadales bacterium]